MTSRGMGFNGILTPVLDVIVGDFAEAGHKRHPKPLGNIPQPGDFLMVELILLPAVILVEDFPSESDVLREVRAIAQSELICAHKIHREGVVHFMHVHAFSTLCKLLEKR